MQGKRNFSIIPLGFWGFSNFVELAVRGRAVTVHPPTYKTLVLHISGGAKPLGIELQEFEAWIAKRKLSDEVLIDVSFDHPC
jgi:hypothetical protein